MSLFIVIPDDKSDSQGIKTLMEGNSLKHYVLNERAIVFISDLTSAELKPVLNVGKGGHNAAIFKLNGAFSGYTSRALWEWLESVEND